MYTNRISRPSYVLGLLLLSGVVLLGSSCRAVGPLLQNADITPAEEADLSQNPEHSGPSGELEGMESRQFPFEYDCEQKSVQIDLYRSIHDFYKAKNKIVYYDPQSPDDWRTKTYLQYLNSSHDEQVISEIIEGIRSELGDPPQDEIALAAVSLVQNLEYDCDKYYSYETSANPEYETNFPYETLYLGSGVCGDFSLLLGKILQELGYGAALLVFSDANHMAIGIQCPNDYANYQKDGVGYCFIETTSPSRIGLVPEFVNDVRLNESDLMIKISEGRTFMKISQLVQSRQADVERYGEFILELATCEEITGFINLKENEFILIDYQAALNDLDSKIEPIQVLRDEYIQKFENLDCTGEITKEIYTICQGIYNSAMEQQGLLDPLVEEYNMLVSESEEISDKYDQDFELFDSLFQENHQGCEALPGE